MRSSSRLALAVAMPRARTVQACRSVWFSGFRKRAFQVYRGVLGFEVSGLGFSGFGVEVEAF